MCDDDGEQDWSALVQAYCHRCGEPWGMTDLASADWVFHRVCAKAEEVYTPPASRRCVLVR